MIRILVIGIETKLPVELKKVSRKEDLCVLTANTGPEALLFLEREEIDVAILDSTFFQTDCVDLIGPMKRIRPFMEIIVLIGWGSVEMAIKAMKLGAFDCLRKPVKISEVSGVLNNACEVKRQHERRHSYPT